jgi:integrase
MAQKVEAKFKTQAIEEDVFAIKPKAPMIQDVWPKYLAWAKLNKRSWEGDESRWTIHIKPHLKGHMDNIKAHQVQSILNRMMPDYKPATVKQVLVLIRRVFNWSKEQSLYEGPNPCDRIKIPKFDNRVTNPLSKGNIESLLKTLETWPNPRAVMIVKFALYSGKRRGEILNMKWPDVDIQNALLSLPQTKANKKQTLPVNKRCMDILMEAEKIRISDYVFSTRTGLFYHGFSNVWKNIRHRAGLEGFRFHDLRHTYASYLASSGKVDIYTLKELLGHSTIEMTQRYAHLVNGALRRAVDVADDVF